MRERSCPEETPGSMVAINSKNIDNLLEKIPQISIANKNTKTQHVITYSKDEEQEILVELKKNRIPFMPLYNIKYPYHSSLLQEASDRLREGVKDILIRDSYYVETSFYSSVTNKLIEPGTICKDEIIELICNQLVTQVDFISFIDFTISRGYSSFIECGPGTNLQTFIKSLLKDYSKDELYKVYPLSRRVDSIKKNRSGKKSKFLKAINGTISKLTGYEISDIKLESKFQEDLGIDSIKKAEILYKIIESNKSIDASKISLSQFKTIDDFVSFFENADESTVNLDFSGDKIDLPFDIYSQELVPYLYSNREKISSIFDFKNLSGNEKNGSYFNLFDNTDLDFENLKSTLLKLKSSIEKISFVFNLKENRSFALSSFIKSYLKEIQITGIFHFVENLDQSLVTDDLTNDLFYFEDKVFASKMKSYTCEPAVEENGHKRVLFIGGHKGVGQLLTNKSNYLSDCEVVVMGRSLEDHRDGNITFVKGDICNEDFMESFFQNNGPFDLCINSAGIEVSKELKKTTLEEHEKVVNVKFTAVRNLINLLERYECPKLIHFSSIVSAFGNQGQCSYSFANEFARRELLDSLKVQTITINWPAWDKVGMTENVGLYLKLSQNGVSFLGQERGVILFDQILNSKFSDNKDFFITNEKENFLFSYELLKPLYDLSLAYPGALIFKESVDFEKHDELLDHELHNLKVMPAKFMINRLTQMLKALMNEYSPYAFNFEMLNMGAFDEDGFEYLVRTNKVDQGFQLELSTKNLPIIKLGNEEISDIKESSLLYKYFSGLSFKTIDSGSIYRKGVVEFGNAFQVLQNSFYNESDKIVLTKGNFRDIGDILEFGFQSLSVLGLLNGGGIAIPNRTKNLSVFNENALIENDVQIFIRRTKQSSKEIYGDFFVYSKDGQMLMSVTGLEMSYINSYKEVPIKLVET